MKKLLANDHRGFILVTVIMLLLVMTTLATSLLSIVSSYGLLGYHQIDRIKAETLARGAYWATYMDLFEDGTIDDPVVDEILDNKSFKVEVLLGVNPGPNGTQKYGTRITY